MIQNKNDFDNFTIENWIDINKYIDAEMDNFDIPFYNSVDIRESSTKYAPVDNNLFPAGFNNLCLLDLEASSKQIESFLKSKSLVRNEVGLLIESNTKNKFYLDNVFFLKKSIEDTGAKVFIISMDSSLFEDESSKVTLETFSKFEIDIYLASIKNSVVNIDCLNKNLEFVLLNNDQSSKISVNWSSITTKLNPSPHLGWFNRHKILHFSCYKEVVEKFCLNFDISPSLLQADFNYAKNINFSTKEGLDELALSVDELKQRIDPEQNVFIKASKGTYGMGIHVVKSSQDVLSLNRKSRNKLDIGKNKIKFSDVIVQEGIETVITYENMPAEVTIYLIGGQSVGGFMRANSQKGFNENLNSKGMVFKKFCISEIRQNRDDVTKEAVYSTIARLSCLAASLETKKLLENLK